MAKKRSASKTTAKTKKKTVKKTATKKAPKKQAAKAGVYKARVQVGEPVPELALPATGGQTVSLSGLRGKNLVLYFYPKDSTPGCTLEGQDFTRLHAQFKSANTEVYGISRDSMKSHENFKSKQCYSIDLLSDEDEKACALFGVIKMKNMYGKQVRGIERSTFVIDAHGNLAKEWRGVSVQGHAEEVLNFVRSL